MAQYKIDDNRTDIPDALAKVLICILTIICGILLTSIFMCWFMVDKVFGVFR